MQIVWVKKCTVRHAGVLRVRRGDDLEERERVNLKKIVKIKWNTCALIDPCSLFQHWGTREQSGQG